MGSGGSDEASTHIHIQARTPQLNHHFTFRELRAKGSWATHWIDTFPFKALIRIWTRRQSQTIVNERQQHHHKHQKSNESLLTHAQRQEGDTGWSLAIDQSFLPQIYNHQSTISFSTALPYIHTYRQTDRQPSSMRIGDDKFCFSTLISSLPLLAFSPLHSTI